LIKTVALSNAERTLAFSRKMLAKNKGPCISIILPWLPLDRQVFIDYQSTLIARQKFKKKNY